ncbi:hypothetical protein CQY20_26055 [Mycolicibacterium agri]|uniref:Uncharacterized protein n=1 Tax=Mycolicibacterium agri TaxID=36811 RepID=A0A2A7MSM8_MYCAG|nr:hypothetical protein CQY20_26055 [Mycolicibacterium agri]
MLASGVVISMSALTGGVAPALAKPDKNDPGPPIVPTWVPEAPKHEAPREAPRAPKQERAPKWEAPPQQAPQAPRFEPPAPRQEAPAPRQVAPAPVQEAPAPKPAPAPEPQAPVVQAPPRQEAPRVVDPPKEQPQVEAPKQQPQVEAPREQPQVEAPKVNAPKPDEPKAPNADAPDGPTSERPNSERPNAGRPNVEAPKNDAAPGDSPKGPNADGPALLPGTDGAAKPDDPKQESPRNQFPGQKPDGEKPDGEKPGATGEKPGRNGETPGAQQPRNEQEKPGSGGDEQQPSKAAKRIPTIEPETMDAPEPDIELAKKAEPIEVKPEPAKKDDVAFLSSALNLSSKTKLGPFESEFHVGSEFKIDDRHRDWDHDRDWDRHRDRDHHWDWDKKHWDKKIRQWDRRWIEYDRWYRPVFFNPYRAPVRIVYVYDRAPRIVYLPPLSRVVVDAAALAAYSFTAVVLNAANLAADVAVGTFFGGGYVPPIGAPFVPPPPLLRYDNVPVQVRYSNATYEPFRVRQIVDVGDDVQYGGRKVLLDGATPVWGQWATAPNGERQFEVHRTQQYPGLGEPQEAPLPGDYQMQLASDESAGIDHTQLYLVAAAGVVAGLGIAALGLAFYLGRRRPQA